MITTDQHPRVLVVEDNLANLQLLKAVLHKDFNLDSAGSAVEARRAIGSSRPDLILMDIGLPDADGIQLTRELRAQPDFDVPIVIITAHALPGDEAAARAAGCNGFITKPINTRSIVVQLKRVLESRSSGRAT